MTIDSNTRREFLKTLGFGAAAMTLSGNVKIIQTAGQVESGIPLASAKPVKPNIILFLTDDQGWTDTSVPMIAGRADTKSDFYQTPNLERMAKEGMVFSNAYAPAPTCTPTRTSIQFGKTPARLRQTIVNDVLSKYRGIRCKEEMPIPQMIKSVEPAYRTAHFGKWGIDVWTPEEAGYDVSDGKTNNGDGDWLVQKETPVPEDDPKRIFSVTKRANDFMEQQVKTGRPFFMQVSHYAVHVQHQALKTTIEKYRKLPFVAKKIRADMDENEMEHNMLRPSSKAVALYAAMIENLDTGLGTLLEKINELGIKDNTYIIFTSDNGGGFQGNAPLNGGKANLWEGGIRVPTVVCGPQVLEDAYCDTPVAGWDFYSTINDLIGGKPLPKEYDGGSLRQLFEKGNKGIVNRGTKELIFHFPWYSGIPMSVIRDGDYKLVMNLITKEVRLYNLADDIGETNDLTKKMPEKTDHLHKRLLDYLKQADAEDIKDMLAARRRQVNEQIEREMKNPVPNKENLDRWQSDLARVDSVENNRNW